jgi:hypothetical protein
MTRIDSLDPSELLPNAFWRAPFCNSEEELFFLLIANEPSESGLGYTQLTRIEDHYQSASKAFLNNECPKQGSKLDQKAQFYLPLSAQVLC